MWGQENSTAHSAAKAAVVNFTRLVALASGRGAIVTGACLQAAADYTAI
ncbi:hypothetical protein ACFSKY_21475 [Azotobacter chroococcum]|nr:hypothetical protein [Azotobacter chroococcum]